MKKMLVGILALMGPCFALVMNACQTAEPVKPMSASIANGTRSAIAVPRAAQGLLWFASLESFNETMKQLQQVETSAQLRDWEDRFASGGFVSLRRLYEQIDAADTTENRRWPTVDSLTRSGKILDCPDSRFATVLSKDGRIGIGDSLYVFRPGFKKEDAYSVPARHLKAVLSGAKPETLDGVSYHTTSFRLLVPQWNDKGGHMLSHFPICFYRSGLMGNWWGQKGGDIYGGDDGTLFPEHNGRQVKLNYHRWRVGYIFYASAGIRCRMLKHTRFAGWQSNTYADQMTMEACAKGLLLLPGVPAPFNEHTSPSWPGFSRYAENNFEKTLVWSANGIFSEILLHHFNFHFQVNYRGRVAERDIRE